MVANTKIDAKEIWKQPIDLRRGPEPQIWIAGCSIAHGLGIGPDQRYGHLVAQHLQQQVSWLTVPGSGIDWAADQIIRADIQSSDIVIWGVTGVNRRVWFKNGEIRRLCTGTVFSEHNWMFAIQEPAVILEQRSYLMDLLLDPANAYHAVRHIMQVQSVCQKLGVRLLIMFHREMSSESDASIIDEHLASYHDVVDIGVLPDIYLDRAPGDPGGHPGPVTNRFWADRILKHLSYE